MSQLYNGTQDYSPKIVNEAAVALNAEPWELLMKPDAAFALRRFRETAREVARNDPPHATPDQDTAPGAPARIKRA